MRWFEIVTMVCSGLGAIGAFTPLYEAFVRRRDEKAERQQSAAGRWSLEVSPSTLPAHWTCTLRYDMDNTPLVHVTQVQAWRPRGLRLAQGTWTIEASGDHVVRPVSADRARSLALHQDVDRVHLGLAGRQPYGVVMVIAQLPPRPWVFSSRVTRLAIRISLESRSSLRTASHLIVTSQQIDWTARRNANTA